MGLLDRIKAKTGGKKLKNDNSFIPLTEPEGPTDLPSSPNINGFGGIGGGVVDANTNANAGADANAGAGAGAGAGGDSDANARVGQSKSKRASKKVTSIFRRQDNSTPSSERGLKVGLGSLGRGEKLKSNITQKAGGIGKVLGTGATPANAVKIPERFAVDVGASSVKVLQMERNGGQGTGWQIVGMGHSPINRTVVADKTIVDSAALAEAIENAIRLAKIRSKHAIAAVPTAQVTIKTITMPKELSMIEQEDYVQVEAPSYIPFPLDEVQMDFEILDTNLQDNNLFDVQIVAVRKDVALPRIEAIEGANVAVSTLDVEQFAIERAVQFLARNVPHEGSDTIDVLVDMGHEFTHMYVLKDGKAIYAKDQNFGMIGLSDEVSRRFGVTQEEAMAKIALAKKAPEAPEGSAGSDGFSSTADGGSFSGGLSLDANFGVKPDTPAVIDPVSGLPLEYFTDSLPQFRHEVANQINRLIQFFFAATSYNRVHRIWIAGGGGALTGIVDEVHELTGVKTYIANPLKMVSEDNARATKEAWDYIESMGPTFLTALGLAIRED